LEDEIEHSRAFGNPSTSGVWSKRLERGRFCPTFSAGGNLQAQAIEAAKLALIIEGIDLSRARRRPRWQPVHHQKKSEPALNP